MVKFSEGGGGGGIPNLFLFFCKFLKILMVAAKTIHNDFRILKTL